MTLMFPKGRKPKRIKKGPLRSEKHRIFVAGLPCLQCGIEGYSQAAHIRVDNGAGLSLKSGDDCCVPLCCARPGVLGCHAWQGGNERGFYGPRLGLAVQTAKQLFENTGDRDAALRILNLWRQL